MTARTAWLVIAAFVALTLWLLAGAVLTVAHRSPLAPLITTPSTTPPVIYQEEP